MNEGVESSSQMNNSTYTALINNFADIYIVSKYFDMKEYRSFSGHSQPYKYKYEL